MDKIVWILPLCLNLLLAFFTSWIAHGKGRDRAMWFVIGFALPTLGLFFAVMLDDNSTEPKFPDPRRRNGPWKKS